MSALLLALTSAGVILPILLSVNAARTKRKYQAVLRAHHRQYLTLADNVHEVVTVRERSAPFRYSYVSPSVERLTGWTVQEFSQLGPEGLIYPNDVERFRDFRRRLAIGYSEARCMFRFRRKSGDHIWLECFARSRPWDYLAESEIVTVTRDASHLVRVGQRAKVQRYRELAFQDSLTGLPNRAALTARLTAALERATTQSGAVSICLLNCDRFKHINYAYRHAIGDLVLRDIGRLIGERLGPGDFLARSGGDEFVLMSERLIHDQEAIDSAQRLLRIFADPLSISGLRIFLTASVGVAVAPAHALTAENLLAAADSALYAAKAAGRNTWRIYSPEIGKMDRRRANASQELRDAFNRGNLLLHYQPKIDLTSGACTGFEALLRVRTSDGLQAPTPYIEAAEHCGFIVPLGEWVFDAAAEQSRAWRSQGVELPIAVNISTEQLQHPGFVGFVCNQVEKDPALPKVLQLELTESALAGRQSEVIAMLNVLKEIGFAIHLDDFGTGYSSMSCLSAMPIDALKIDRIFINGIEKARDKVEIVRAVVGLASALHLKTIAEGVESRAHVEILQKLGCDQAQGFLFARALDPDEALRFARQCRISAAPKPSAIVRRAGSPMTVGR